MNKFLYEFYIKDADPEGVEELLPILREFYTRYPTGNEHAEATHQLRRELNMIQEVEQKRRKIKQLQEELDSEYSDK